jgi:DNA polymerase III alpha subunit
MDKTTNSIYKGLESIKFMNSDVAEALYDLRDQQFNSFTDLLSVFPGNSRQLDLLIRLNYFSEFGGSLRLLKIAELYDKYNGKKVLKKEKLDLPIEIATKYAKSETEKQYRFEPEGML